MAGAGTGRRAREWQAWQVRIARGGFALLYRPRLARVPSQHTVSPVVAAFLTP